MTRVVSEGAGNGLLVKLPVGAERADDFAAFEDAHDAYVIFSNELALNVVRAPDRLFPECTAVKGNILPGRDAPVVQPGASLQIVEIAERDVDVRIGEIVDDERRIASHELTAGHGVADIRADHHALPSSRHAPRGRWSHRVRHPDGAGIKNSTKPDGLAPHVPDRQDGPVDEEGAVVEPAAVEFHIERPVPGLQTETFYDRDATGGFGLWLEFQRIFQVLCEVATSEVGSRVASRTLQGAFQVCGSRAYATDRTLALREGAGRGAIESEHVLVARKYDGS